MKKNTPLTASRPVPPGERLVALSLCGMVTGVPLAIWPGLFNYAQLPKQALLSVSASFCCLGWLMRTGWGKQVRWSARTPGLPGALWLGVGVLSAFAAGHPFEAAGELLIQAVLLILMCAVADTISFERLTPVWWACALTGLGVGLVGILQYHSLSFIPLPSNAPPSVTFANRNLAAEYLIGAIPLSAYLFLASPGRLSAVSGLAGTLMGVYLVYTRTRGAWAGLGLGLLCAGVALALRPAWRAAVVQAVGARMDRSRKRWTLGLVILFLLLSALPPRIGTTASPLAGKTSVAAAAATVFRGSTMEQDAGLRDRFAFWKNTLRMAMDHPLLGVGPGGWMRVYPLYDGGATISPRGVPRHPHNDVLWVASEYGLIGLLFYAWFWVAGLATLVRMAGRPEPAARLAALLFGVAVLAILGDACFAFPKDQPQAMMFPCLLIGLAAGAATREKDKIAPLSLWGRGWGRGLPYLSLLIALAAVLFSCQRIAFDRHYRNAYVQGVARNWPAMLPEAQSALAYGVFQPDILYFKGLSLQNVGRYPEAEETYRLALVYQPHAWYVHAGLAAVCFHQGRPQEALRHGQIALAICPGATALRKDLARVYGQMGDTAYAQERFADALGAYRSFLANALDDTAGVGLARERIAQCERAGAERVPPPR